MTKNFIINMNNIPRVTPEIRKRLEFNARKRLIPCPSCNNPLQALDFDDGMSTYYGMAEPTEPECYWCDACDKYYLTEELQ